MDGHSALAVANPAISWRHARNWLGQDHAQIEECLFEQERGQCLMGGWIFARLHSTAWVQIECELLLQALEAWFLHTQYSFEFPARICSAPFSLCLTNFGRANLLPSICEEQAQWVRLLQTAGSAKLASFLFARSQCSPPYPHGSKRSRWSKMCARATNTRQGLACDWAIH